MVDIDARITKLEEELLSLYLEEQQKACGTTSTEHQ